MQSITAALRSRAAALTLLAAALLGPVPGHAQLRLDITQGVRDAVPIAVVPFGGQADGGAADVAAVIANDLRMSGRFAPLERRDLVARPTSGAEIRYEDWRLLRSDFIVVGRVEPDGSALAVSFELHNVRTGASLLAQRLPSTDKGLRATAHRIADLVFERLTGIPGAFSTRIAYVAVDGKPPAQRYRLLVSDADGYNPRTVLESREPIMSPAWSPDGRKLALTLSRDGNLDIYTLELATQTLTRVTSDEAIDTEPEWSRDGQSLYFTSDRAGNAQVYRVVLDQARKAERVTFTNAYNARPRVSPDGKELALVTLDRGGYRIAVMDIASRNLRVLTNARQDESPSFAPNGALVLYATRDRGRGSLAIASSDGAFQQRLSSDQGDVRDPAWQPFAPRG